MAISTDSAFVDVNVRYRVIGLKESANEAKKAENAFSNFGKILKNVALSLAAFKIIQIVTQNLVGLLRVTYDINSLYQRTSIQLEAFTGTARRSAEVMQFLAFQSTRLAGGLDDLLEGSTALESFGLRTQEHLEFVADIAQATNRSIEDIAVAMGRVVAGDPRTKQFIVTRRGDLIAFNQALSEGKTRLEAFQIAFERFIGVSSALGDTTPRQVERLFDMLKIGLLQITQSGIEKVTGDLKGFNDELERMLFITDRSGNKAPRSGGGILTNIFHKITGFKGTGTDIGLPEATDKELTQELVRMLQERRVASGKRRFEIDEARIALGRPKDIDPPLNRRLEWQLEIEADIIEGRMKAEQEISDDRFQRAENERSLMMRWNKDIEKMKDEAQEERIKKALDAEKQRLSFLSTVSDRAVDELGFLFFGSVESNKAIDRQVEALKEELNIINGITTPLTRQEELLNSIVRLESERIGINERLGSVVRRLIGDLINAAAKAALLTTINRGKGGFGFLDFLKQGLGLATLIPGPHQILTGAGAIGLNTASFGGFGTNTNSTVAGSKPIVMNNPVFLSSDIGKISRRSLAEESDRIK